jgi:hypothetical protein
LAAPADLLANPVASITPTSRYKYREVGLPVHGEPLLLKTLSLREECRIGGQIVQGGEIGIVSRHHDERRIARACLA